MLYTKKLRIVLLSHQVCLPLCQFQNNALIFGLWISFLAYQIVKVPILFFPILKLFTKFVQLIPCFKGEGALSVPKCANFFSSNIVMLFGKPKMVLCNRDSRFMSKFGKALWELLGTKVFFISAYYP